MKSDEPIRRTWSALSQAIRTSLPLKAVLLLYYYCTTVLFAARQSGAKLYVSLICHDKFPNVQILQGSQLSISSLQFLQQIGTNGPSPVTSLPMTFEGPYDRPGIVGIISRSAHSSCCRMLAMCLLAGEGGGEQYDLEHQE